MNEELSKALQGGKASRKMINIWILRWAFATYSIIFGICFGGWLYLVIVEAFPLDFYTVLISIVITILLSFVFTFAFCRYWAKLYWKNYNFKLESDRITIKRGIIGKNIVNIPYERIQNVNVWRGILDRIYGLSTIKIETAGSSFPFTGGYGSFSFAEGTIQGLENPQPIVEYLMARAKGKDGLGDIRAEQPALNKDEKIKLLEERLLKAQISEATYKELKQKYEKQA